MAGANEQMQAWLAEWLRQIGGVAGTLHLHQDGGLRLVAAVNIPEAVQQVVAWVPSGKGMAGLALERGEAVQTCNLQDDRSGAVRPGAKAVNAQAAVALPLYDSSGSIIAVAGAAFAGEREIDDTELQRMRAAAATPPIE
jgi:L-methionine (R)-S-oxide reductase